jgi:hypothetical protein
MIAVHLVLLLIAFVCLLLAAIEVQTPRINLTALGLALWLLTLIIR